MALELASYGVKVNCMAPAPAETDILKNSEFSDTMIERSNSEMKKMHPLGRRGKPQEVANIVLKICDPSTNWLTGQIISVDGGMSIA